MDSPFSKLAMETYIDVGIWAAFSYLYNTGGVEFAVNVYGTDHVSTYLEEKASIYSISPARAIGELDAEHQLKLLQLVKAKSAAAAAQHLQLIKGH